MELRPAEPEESDGEEDALDAGEVEPAFRGGGEFAGRVAPGEAFLVDGDEGGDEGADTSGGVDGADGGNGEGVIGAEDEGKGFELEVEHSRRAELDREGIQGWEGLIGRSLPPCK